MEYIFTNLTNEDVSKINESFGFSGFLTTSPTMQTTTAVASTSHDLDLETQPRGKVQPSVVELLNPELASGAVAPSTSLGGPADGPTEPTKVGQGGPEAVCSLELADGPLAHSTPQGKPAEDLADSAKADEADSEAGFQLDRAARKKATRKLNLSRKRLTLSQLDGRPNDNGGAAENLADSAKTEEAGSKAEPRLDRVALKRAKNRRRRQAKHLVSQFDRLSTSQPINLPGCSGTASKRGRNSSGSSNKTDHTEPAQKRGKGDAVLNLGRGNSPKNKADHTGPAQKRGKGDAALNLGRGNSPKNKSKQEGDDREGPLPGRLSFAEAASKSVSLVVTPLDLNGNTIGAVADDRTYIMEMIERKITSGTPKVVIKNIYKQGLGLKIDCLGPNALDFVKRVISPLKGPSKITNRKGYQCLGPGDRPPVKVYGVWTEKPILTKQKFVELIMHANEWIKPHMFHVVKACHKKIGGDTKGVTFLVGVTPELKAKLEGCNFKISYGAGRVAHFKDKPKPKGNRGNP